MDPPEGDGNTVELLGECMELLLELPGEGVPELAASLHEGLLEHERESNYDRDSLGRGSTGYICRHGTVAGATGWRYFRTGCQSPWRTCWNMRERIMTEIGRGSTGYTYRWGTLELLGEGVAQQAENLYNETLETGIYMSRKTKLTPSTYWPPSKSQPFFSVQKPYDWTSVKRKRERERERREREREIVDVHKDIKSVYCSFQNVFAMVFC